MSTPDTIYYLDGVPLDDPQGRWFVDSTSDCPPLPGLRTSSVVAAGLDGEIFFPNEPYAAGKMGMTVNVTDVDVDGKPSYAALQDNLDVVKRMFLSRSALHVLQKTQGGRHRQTDVRVSAATTPKELGSGVVQIKFVLDMPVPLWRDVNTRPDDVLASVNGNGMTFVVFPLNGATARCGHGELQFSGGFKTLRVTDVATGGWLQINAEVPRTQAARVFLDSLSVLLYENGEDKGSLDGFVDIGPGGFAMTPRFADGLTMIRVQPTGLSGGLTVDVHLFNAKRSYL